MRRSKEEAAKTRCAILDAAERVFCEQGVSSATLEKISQAAGVTRGAFYWHFKDKGDLLRALKERCAPLQRQLVFAAAEKGHDDPLRLLEKSAIEILELLEVDERQQRLFVIMWGYIPNADETNWFEEFNAELFGATLRLTSQGQEKGFLSSDFDPNEAAVMLMASMSGLLSEWLRSGRAFSLKDIGGKIVRKQMQLLMKVPVVSSDP
ncbi:TetR family transcriptional regulator [Consotaella aegiceratis]|uniref:TetR family transcriptional regulator n=1 Tax=Consotaella aegiceratis TaxID=3097961 RepID=UPI002F3F2E6F